jgi:predicted HicB family RNase H-like nuclease
MTPSTKLRKPVRKAKAAKPPRKIRAVRSYEQSANVIIRVSPEVREALNVVAQERGTSVNALLGAHVETLTRGVRAS